MDELSAFFRRPEAPARRGKFLSRLFGIFSEEIVRCWCGHDDATYRDLGRPTVTTPDGRRHTLDFTLECRATGQSYVAEMKCEIEYQGYRYLTLRDPRQLDHHAKPAFAAFLAAAREPNQVPAAVKGVPCHHAGAIMIWGSVTPEGRAQVIDEYGLRDVLSVDAMLADLRRWKSPALAGLLAPYRAWTTELFDFLAPPGVG